MGATWSFTKTFVAGAVLLASELNTLQSDVTNNFTPAGMDDASANATAMKVTADPGEVGTESLATSLTGELQRLRNAIKEINGQVQWYTTPLARYHDFSRAEFARVDDENITISPASYWCKDKFCWWNATLTSTDLTGITSDWVYLYLDYSAITSGTEITNAELIWSVDEPSWNDEYKSWIRTSTNTDDRCIFAVRTDGTDDILEFFHGNDFVVYGDYISATLEDSTPSNTFSDVTFIVPSFVSKVKAFVYCTWIDTNSFVSWRTKGSIASTGGMVIGYVHSDSTASVIVSDFITNSSQVIEIKYDNASAGNTISSGVHGWYFPVGM